MTKFLGCGNLISMMLREVVDKIIKDWYADRIREITMENIMTELNKQPTTAETLKDSAQYFLAAMESDRAETPIGFGKRMSKCRVEVRRLIKRLKDSGQDQWALPVCDALIKAANYIEDNPEEDCDAKVRYTFDELNHND